MITKYFGRTFSIQKLRALCQITHGGVTFLDMSEAAEKLGLHSIGAKLDVAQLKELELLCNTARYQEGFFPYNGPGYRPYEAYRKGIYNQLDGLG